MAESSWSDSWGDAWGDSWGAIGEGPPEVFGNLVEGDMDETNIIAIAKLFNVPLLAKGILQPWL